MKIAITGASGFIGHYIVRRLLQDGHQLRCWHRHDRPPEEFHAHRQIEWIKGELGNRADANALVEGCDQVVHAALWKPGASFRGGEGDIVEFCNKNLIGTLQLLEAARLQPLEKFVFISTCAVHERILDDRKLDEAHPLWPLTHYGAHKAAIEKFVHSYGFGYGFPVCALRPTGVYGRHHQPQKSKWYDLIRQIVQGESVEAEGGGKEVHAADVAEAVSLLLDADGIAGLAFNCYDRYISRLDVAKLARDMAGSPSEIQGATRSPKHQIETARIRKLGMKFGGDELLRSTINQLVQHVQKQDTISTNS